MSPTPPSFVRPPSRAEAAHARRLLDGSAWDEFCEALKSAGRDLFAADMPLAEQDYADGYRFLARIASGGLRQAIEHADPQVPQWVYNDTTCKHSGDNADNRYLLARIDPDCEYRIHGLRRNAMDLVFVLSPGYMQQGEVTTSDPVSFNDAFEARADGSFEIFLGARRREGNWLPLPPGSRLLTVRQYLVDWAREEPAYLRIERVGHEGLPPREIDPARLGAILDDAAAWIRSNTLFWPRWVAGFHRQRAAGELHQARGFEGEGGVPGIRYANNAFSLAADEALILEGRPPDARYWSFQLLDNFMASLDYANHQTSLNGHQIALDSDGRYRIVVSHRDPGLPNWLDPCGRCSGMLLWRWIWSRDEPQVRIRRLPFAELRAALPLDTPVVDPAERRRAIAVRQAHVALRERSS